MKQLDLFNGIEDAKFPDYHKLNPQIFIELEKISLHAYQRGITRWSIEAAFNIVRWNRFTTAADYDGFKINNSYKAFYSRMLMNKHPELRGFFKTRRSKYDRVNSVV